MVFNLGFGTGAPQWNTYKEFRRILVGRRPSSKTGRHAGAYPDSLGGFMINAAGAIDAGQSKGVIMGFFGFLLLGLLAGALAKLILPGTQGGGWFVTLLLGVVGALLGGWLAGLIFGVDMGSFFDLRTWVIAILGSIVVLLIYGLATRNRTSSS